MGKVKFQCLVLNKQVYFGGYSHMDSLKILMLI